MEHKCPVEYELVGMCLEVTDQRVLKSLFSHISSDGTRKERAQGSGSGKEKDMWREVMKVEAGLTPTHHLDSVLNLGTTICMTLGSVLLGPAGGDSLLTEAGDRSCTCGSHARSMHGGHSWVGSQTGHCCGSGRRSEEVCGCPW